MSSSPTPTSSASVRNILTLLASRDAHLVGGAGGLERRITWSCRMRSRLPAFESVRGGELALLTLPQLRRLDETLPHLLKSLHREGVAAVAVAASSPKALGDEAVIIADQLHFPLILLPSTTPLEEIEREVITFVVSFRGEIERKASEISHQLMQLSIQGVGIQGVCEHLARSCHTWVVVQDAEQHVRLQAAPTPDERRTLLLPPIITDDWLWEQGLTRIVAPIQIHHEVVGYLAFIGDDGAFDSLERIMLGQVVPILALEFAREKERSAVESRYSYEALMDVLQGNYQQPEEMLARARLLGYDLTSPQIVAIFEISPASVHDRSNGFQAQWGRRVRDELLRDWPTSWILVETTKVTAILPLAFGEFEAAPATKEGKNYREDTLMLARLERVQSRLQQTQSHNSITPAYSIGLGRAVQFLVDIPQSFREAQQALEIGRRLFGENKLHSFSHLGIYRLLFHLEGQSELDEFYTEILGPILQADTRGDGTLIETLEIFFRCNGNLSETARSMHLHRNSLLYRLGRVEELLGRSLEDAELRLSLQIALKIRHLRHT